MTKNLSKIKNIALVTTGGTISGIFDPIRRSIRATDNGDKLLSGLGAWCAQAGKPSIGEIASIIPADVIAPLPLLSEDMTPHEWQSIAKAVAQEINSGSDGVIVTHGTDTMAYTSAALSFMLKELSVPVVLTGSNFPPDYKETDAFSNLYDGAIVAASELSGVFVVFGGFIHRGTKVRKVIFRTLEDFHTMDESARHNVIAPDSCFISVNTGQSGAGTSPLGYIDKHRELILLQHDVPYRTGSPAVKLDTRLDPDVCLLKVYPGFKPSLILALAEQGIKGIILELYDSGTGCTRQDEYKQYSLVDPIKKAVEAGAFVFVTSQQVGKVYKTVYEPSQKLYEDEAEDQAGAVALKDMTTESAVVKLMWVFGHTKERQKVKEKMLDPIAGECSKE